VTSITQQFPSNDKIDSSPPMCEGRFFQLPGQFNLGVHFPPQEERNGNQKEEGGPIEEKDLIQPALEKV
jgi:hypothetical protein